MSAQLTYKYNPVKGAPGAIYDLAPFETNTYLNEEATGTKVFGKAVVDSSTAAGTYVKLPTATTDKFRGIVTNNRTTEFDMEGNVVVKNKAAMAVMYYGRIMGKLATGVTPTFGAQVYVVCAGDDKGCFTTSSSSTMPINATFASGADNGCALIELNHAPYVS
jgi:hypothetical protein